MFVKDVDVVWDAWLWFREFCPRSPTPPHIPSFLWISSKNILLWIPKEKLIPGLSSIEWINIFEDWIIKRLKEVSIYQFHRNRWSWENITVSTLVRTLQICTSLFSVYTERASAYLLWPVSKWKERQKTVLLEPTATEGRNESHQACADSRCSHQSFHTKAPAQPTAREPRGLKGQGPLRERTFIQVDVLSH